MKKLYILFILTNINVFANQDSSMTWLFQLKQNTQFFFITSHILFLVIIFILILILYQRKKHFNELTLLNQRLNLVIEGSNGNLIDWDEDNKQVNMSNNLSDVLNLKENSSIDTCQSLIDQIHPDDKEFLLNNLDKYLKDERLFITNIRVLDKQGTWKYFKSFIKSYYDNNKKIFRKLVFNIDETEKIKLENQNRMNEKYLEEVFNVQPNITMLVNEKSILKVNAAFVNFFNIQSKDDFVEKNLCISDFFVKRKDYLQKYINSEFWIDYVLKNPYKVHKALIKKDDELCEFMVVAKYIKKDQSKEILVVLSDVTQLSIQQETIVQQEKRALMGDMIENIAHQWRQPLSAISITASGLKLRTELNDLSNEELVFYCDSITKNVNYLSETIDDFRDFYNHSNKITNFTVKQLVDDVLGIFNFKFLNRHIEVITDLEDINIKGSKSELLQVFMNLFSNSNYELEKKDGSRLIFVEAKYTNDKMVRISIKDNAGGVPKKIADNIFDAHFTTKKKDDGTGIGLFMSKNIIEEHFLGSLVLKNETYKYKNEEYTGAKFIIDLATNNYIKEN